MSSDKAVFFRSAHCRSLKSCHKCRADRSWREMISEAFDVYSIDFECPYGFTTENIPLKECKYVGAMPKCKYIDDEVGKIKEESTCSDGCCQSKPRKIYKCHLQGSVIYWDCFNCDDFSPDI